MKSKPLIMGLVFVVLWSSAFTSAKIIVNHAPPLLALGVRFFLTGLFGLILFQLFYKKVAGGAIGVVVLLILVYFLFLKKK